MDELQPERAEVHARFAARVAERRRELGLTQQVVADSVGRSQPMVARIESGESRADAADVVLIARVLDIDLNDLAGLTEDAMMRPSPERAELFPRFAAQVGERRRELGLTQRQLADLVGRSHSMVSRIESGQRRPDFADGLLIARALDIDLNDLLTP